jgi:hypothetical protein
MSIVSFENAEDMQEPTVPVKKQPHRFQKGVSGNPKGKPKGTLDFRSTIKMAMLKIEANAEEIVDKVIDMAKNGDPACIKIVMDRIIPVKKDPLIAINNQVMVNYNLKNEDAEILERMKSRMMEIECKEVT